MSNHKKETTKATYFTINCKNKLKACEITINGRHSEDEVKKYLENLHISSANKFYLLLDVVA